MLNHFGVCGQSIIYVLTKNAKCLKLSVAMQKKVLYIYTMCNQNIFLILTFDILPLQGQTSTCADCIVDKNDNTQMLVIPIPRIT